MASSALRRRRAKPKTRVAGLVLEPGSVEGELPQRGCRPVRHHVVDVQRNALHALRDQHDFMQSALLPRIPDHFTDAVKLLDGGLTLDLCRLDLGGPLLRSKKIQ